MTLYIDKRLTPTRNNNYKHIPNKIDMKYIYERKLYRIKGEIASSIIKV